MIVVTVAGMQGSVMPQALCHTCKFCSTNVKITAPKITVLKLLWQGDQWSKSDPYHVLLQAVKCPRE